MHGLLDRNRPRLRRVAFVRQHRKLLEQVDHKGHDLSQPLKNLQLLLFVSLIRNDDIRMHQGRFALLDVF
jgi:hypothetical protein